jgi:hypothetical protein
MNLKKINEQLKPKIPDKYIPSRRYGVMGVALGGDLHHRLQVYAKQHNLRMGQIIKLLVKSYLDEMEGK